MPRVDPNELHIQKCPKCGGYLDMDTGICKTPGCGYDADKEDEKVREREKEPKQFYSNSAMWMYYPDKEVWC